MVFLCLSSESSLTSWEASRQILELFRSSVRHPADLMHRRFLVENHCDPTAASEKDCFGGLLEPPSPKFHATDQRSWSIGPKLSSETWGMELGLDTHCPHSLVNRHQPQGWPMTKISQIEGEKFKGDATKNRGWAASTLQNSCPFEDCWAILSLDLLTSPSNQIQSKESELRQRSFQKQVLKLLQPGLAKELDLGHMRSLTPLNPPWLMWGLITQNSQPIQSSNSSNQLIQVRN